VLHIVSCVHDVNYTFAHEFLREYNEEEEEKYNFEHSMKIYENFQKFCDKNGPFGKRGITMKAWINNC